MSMAWGGYETMIRGFREPELFRKFAAQSFLGFEEEVQQTLDAYQPLAEGEEPWVGYIDWGTLDIRSPSEGWDMRRSARTAYESLQSMGVALSGGEVVDTTDWKSWRLRTHLVLSALFPATEKSTE